MPIGTVFRTMQIKTHNINQYHLNLPHGLAGQIKVFVSFSGTHSASTPNSPFSHVLVHSITSSAQLVVGQFGKEQSTSEIKFLFELL